MFDYIQKTYDFTDYQIAQLRFFFLTIFSEISKLVIIGLFYINELPLYLWTMFIFLLMRTTTGGLHCRTYPGCLTASFCYILLCIRILPMIFINKLIQMIMLFACILISYHTGPVTSPIHLALTKKRCHQLKNRLFIIIFFYLILTYILPADSYINAGFWVIILNTLQLRIAKFYYKEAD